MKNRPSPNLTSPERESTIGCMSTDRVTIGEFSKALETVAELLATGDNTGIEGGNPSWTGFVAEGTATQIRIQQSLGQAPEGGFLDSRGIEHIGNALRFAGERVNSARNSFISGWGSKEAVTEAEQLAHTLAEGYHTLSGAPGYKFKEG